MPDPSPTTHPPAARPRTAVRVRFAAWQGLIVAHLLAGVLLCYLLAGPQVLDNLPWLMAGWLGMGGLLLAFWALLVSTPPDAIRTSPGVGVVCVVAGAALLQAAAVAGLAPVLSDDAVRYRLDGRAWAAGYSPYAHSPAELEALTAAGTYGFDSVDRSVGHPSIATIYLPTSQLVFIPLAAAEPAVRLPQPHERDWRELARELTWAERLPVFKLAFGLLAVAGTALVCRLLLLAGQSPWWAVLFGWNPLVMVEAGGMAHQDVLGVTLLLGSLLAFARGRPVLAGCVLAAAVLVKPLALVLLPFWLREADGPGRVRLLLAGAVTGFVLLLPLLYQSGYQQLAVTMSGYLGTWEANGLVHRALEPLLTGTFGLHRDVYALVSRGLGLFLLLAAFGGLWWFKVSAVPAAYGLMVVSLLVSPVVYPWYLLWPLALVPLLPRAGLVVLVWSGTVVLSYQLLDEPVWRLPWPVLLAEYVPVLAAAVLLLAWRLRRPDPVDLDPPAAPVSNPA